MATLTEYRNDLGNLLATAVDPSTWTTAMLDQALRMALDELNGQLVYEGTFTVSVTGYEQDLSSMSAINSILALAYPWQDGWSFGEHLSEWRVIGVNRVAFHSVQPAAGEVIRVRYSKLHLIQSLDAAVSTTVPDHARFLVGLWAAAYACDLRVRQLSENPALPKEAVSTLRLVANNFRIRAKEAISHVPPLGRLRWGDIGL
jgi:hypothetical protein